MLNGHRCPCGDEISQSFRISKICFLFRIFSYGEGTRVLKALLSVYLKDDLKMDWRSWFPHCAWMEIHRKTSWSELIRNCTMVLNDVPIVPWRAIWNVLVKWFLQWNVYHEVSFDVRTKHRLNFQIYQTVKSIASSDTSNLYLNKTLTQVWNVSARHKLRPMGYDRSGPMKTSIELTYEVVSRLKRLSQNLPLGSRRSLCDTMNIPKLIIIKLINYLN